MCVYICMHENLLLLGALCLFVHTCFVCRCECALMIELPGDQMVTALSDQYFVCVCVCVCTGVAPATGGSSSGESKAGHHG